MDSEMLRLQNICRVINDMPPKPSVAEKEEEIVEEKPKRKRGRPRINK